MEGFIRIANAQELSDLSMLMVGQDGWFSDVSMERDADGNYSFKWNFDCEDHTVKFTAQAKSVIDSVMPNFPDLLDTTSPDFGKFLNLMHLFYVSGLNE